MDWETHPPKPFWWMGLPQFWKPSFWTFWPQIQNMALIPCTKTLKNLKSQLGDAD